MRPRYLHMAMRLAMNQDLEEKMQDMVETILLRNADFDSQSAALVLADVLAFRYKVCEFLPLVGREYKQLHKFLFR